MAEILLSLTIIGVVAAITLPSLTGNINERTWNTQRKALYARFSQAIALMPALNGYGTLTEGNESTSAVDTAAETFVTEGLSKVLKINNICDSDHLADCGIASKLTATNGAIINFPSKMSELNPGLISASTSGYGSYSALDTKAAAFETQNGESIIVYYNPRCIGSLNEMDAGNTAGRIGNTYYAQLNMCANFIYDLNGNKGPNTVGKDIGFITVLYPYDSAVVAPVPLVKDAPLSYQDEANAECKKMDVESRLPNIDELSAMFYNKILLGMQHEEMGHYWSSTLFSASQAWSLNFNTSFRFYYPRHQDMRSTRCVKR